ncbi:response regulator transcription factor [Streptomyces glaucosporus]|uniref:Response regulator transcription factor n=1 Tax=Streptomyces glaucosporus TaxID=284044 RepID=A0ABP5V6X8_9ACTN
MPDDVSRAPGRHHSASQYSADPRQGHAPDRVPPPPPPTDPLPPMPPPAAAAPLRVVVADDNPVVRAGLTVLLQGRDDIRVVAEAADGREACEATWRHRPDVVLLDVRMPGVDGISALPHLVRMAPVLMLTYSRESEVVHEALRLGAGGYLVHGEFTADQLVSAVRDTREGRAHFTSTASTALLASLRGTAAAPGRPLPDGLGTAPTGAGHLSTGPGQQSALAHGGPEQSAHLWPSRRYTRGEDVVSNASYSSPDASQEQSLVAQSDAVPGMSRAERFGLSAREAEVMELIASGMANPQIAAACFISEKTVKNHINRIFAKLHAASRSEAIAVWLGTARTGIGRGRTGHG